MNYKLQKNERLHSKKSIKELFDKGSSFFLYPFKVYVLDIDGDETNQVLFSVSKKKIRKAVDRNYIKRRVREAYRLHKHLLVKHTNQKKLIAFVYVSSELNEYSFIRKKMIQILSRISKTQQTKNDKIE